MKTKGVIIIPVKFRSGRELLALKCFIIFYTQMFSSFENWDIQDLTLSIFFFSADEMNNIDSEDEVFAEELPDKESDYEDSDDEDI